MARSLDIPLNLYGASAIDDDEDDDDDDEMADPRYHAAKDQFESQDDLIEDYEICSIKPPCCHHRTTCEKVLLAILFMFIIAVIALAVALSNAAKPLETKVLYCSSQECVVASSSLLTVLNNTQHPCVDFYSYACGGWLDHTPVPKGKLSWDRFQEVADNTYYMLEKLLVEENPTFHNEAEEKAKYFYQSCTGAANLSSVDFLEDYQRLIDRVGGWTIGKASYSNSTGHEWDFQETLQRIHALRAFPLFSIVVDIDEKKPWQNIFKIEPGVFGISPLQLRIPAGNDTDVEREVESYRQQIIRTGAALGGDMDTLADKADSIIELERLLAQTYQFPRISRNRNALYNSLRVVDLTEALAMKDFNWTVYIESFWQDVLPRESLPEMGDYVVVYDMDYLREMAHVVNLHLDTPEGKETIRNYVVWTLISSLEKYIGSEVFDKYRTNDIGDWKRCIFNTNQAFSFVTGALYMNRTFDQSYVDEVRLLVQYIKEAFKDYLLQKFWMDKPTKQAASEKIDAIIEKISYISVVTNTTFLDDLYKDFSVNSSSDWFESVLHWKQFESRNMVNHLSEKPSRESWLSAPVTLNAFYSPERNDLFFPAAVFQPPFFSPGRPRAMNFGSLGSLIGHEITHAFDTLGRQFDKDGRLKYWWGNLTAQNYEKTVPCMVKQYSKYTLKDRQVNGNFTLDENIADNGGLRAAFLGYQLWKHHYPHELTLPGVNMTHDQLFFISFAQTYCAKYTPEGAYLAVTTDTHSPYPPRVTGSVMNSDAFTHVFRCGLMAPMNAVTRCQVW